MKDLVINEWYKGIAESPHLGFHDIRNVDIFTSPGIAQPNYKTAKVSATTVTGLPKWIVKNPGGNFYALDSAGVVYKSSTGSSWSVVSGNTTTSAAGNGLVIWKSYLLVMRNAFIDVMKISDESWTNGWQALTTDSEWHMAIVGQDDIVYIGNSRYIASLSENTGQTFAPGTAATYTYTAQALDLPAQYRVKCLAELGVNLMIGTLSGDADYTGNTADIFPWDRVSTSFNIPIRIAERGVHQLLNHENLLYITAGITGNIYISNGSNTQLLRKLPDSIINLSSSLGTFITYFPGAIMSYNGRVYFGVSSGTQSGSVDGIGVWSVTRKGNLTFEHTISTGTVNPTNNLFIGALYPWHSTYFIGWRDNTTYGIDNIDGNRFASYASKIKTPLYQVGTPLSKFTFTQVEFTLDRPMIANDGIKISYRTNLTANFTEIGTRDFATNGGIDFDSLTFPAISTTNVQFLIETQGAVKLRNITPR